MDASPLATLSSELRNVVYEYIFTSRFAVTLATGQCQHPLARTCRQLRHETLKMYLSLTKFNAHLDDGPATPLAKWLEVLGTDLAASVGEVNIWDMHMLNGTLHGSTSTAQLLATGPASRTASLSPSPSTPGSPQSAHAPPFNHPDPSEHYILRPVASRQLYCGWYLREVLVALHTLNLDLHRLCIVSANPNKPLRMTSDFAIVSLDKSLEDDPVQCGSLLNLGAVDCEHINGFDME